MWAKNVGVVSEAPQRTHSPFLKTSRFRGGFDNDVGGKQCLACSRAASQWLGSSAFQSQHDRTSDVIKDYWHWIGALSSFV